MARRLEQLLEGHGDNYIYPFLWMHGEPHNIILEELEQIYSCGIRGICVEARPHPDFGGEHWFRDMDLIMDFAREREMKVWLLDDDRFPTGHANGAFKEGDHQLANEFMTYWCTDVAGPLPSASLLVKPVLKEDSYFLGAAMYKRVSEDSAAVDLSSGIPLTGQLKNGWLRMDIPEGLWRIYFFFTTHHGDGKLDYFNILNSESVRLLIDRVHEPHYQRYKDDFGKTFTAFFSDEQEFANLPGYDFQARLGKNMKFIPWSKELEVRLRKRYGESYDLNCAALFTDAGPETGKIRYAYMDEVTKQLKVAFSGQISQWCQEHGVIHVGHIIEDDNSHGRLGCSTGHYFRSLSGMGMAGIDVVLLQIMPGMNQTIHQWVASDRDGEFFHYGLGKMGSSLAHIDRQKQGRAMCEIFGAFGWQEGVSLMKWLADHMMCRGINYFVPHAFSPKAYPDPDCPPHFHARGHHAQLPWFSDLMHYMNRVSHLMTGGTYPAEAAVLYHADSEWAGEAMLFQKPVRALLEQQIECDIIPADILAGDVKLDSKERYFAIADQKYHSLIIPGSEFIPESAADIVPQLMKHGIQVIFVDHYPQKICEAVNAETEREKLGYCRQAGCVSLDQLGETVKSGRERMTDIKGDYPDLRQFVYQHDDCTLFYYFNESTEQAVETSVVFNCRGSMVYRYDAMKNKLYQVKETQQIQSGGKTEVKLSLEPGEAVIYLAADCELPVASLEIHSCDLHTPLCGIFSPESVSIADTESFVYIGSDVQEKSFEYEEDHTIRGSWQLKAYRQGTDDALIAKEGAPFGDLTDWLAENNFNGVLDYESLLNIEISGEYLMKLFGCLDVEEILLDGVSLGRCIGAPHEVRFKAEKGCHQLKVRLAVTPVFEVGDDWSALTVLPPVGLAREPEIYKIEQG